MASGWNKVTIRTTDKLFSLYVRQKAEWKCEVCHKLCKVNGEWVAQLDASHYFGRRAESTRFDTDNVHALCSACHRRMGGHTRDEKGEYDVWIKNKLGEQRYKMLRVRHNTTQKRDDKMTTLYIKQLLSELPKEV